MEPVKGLTGHVFISYARPDARSADELRRVFEAAGVRVWRDSADLRPGEDRRARIRQVITADALVFIACFSCQSVARATSYQYEEIRLAVDELRRRRPGEPWLIPVRFDDCAIPDFDIGGGRTLASLQRADLFGDHRSETMTRLLAAVPRTLRVADSSGPPLTAAPAVPPAADIWRDAAMGFSSVLFRLYPAEYHSLCIRLAGGDPRSPATMLALSPPDRSARVLRSVPPDKAAAILGNMGEQQAAVILALIPERQRQAIVSAAANRATAKAMNRSGA